MSDVWSERERTARKPYTCEEAGPRGCKRTAKIEPGTRYVYVSGIYEGEPFSLRFCLRCLRAWGRSAGRFRWDDEGPCAGELACYLRENRDLRCWARAHALRQRVKLLRAQGSHRIADEWEALHAKGGNL